MGVSPSDNAEYRAIRRYRREKCDSSLSTGFSLHSCEKLQINCGCVMTHDYLLHCISFFHIATIVVTTINVKRNFHCLRLRDVHGKADASVRIETF